MTAIRAALGILAAAGSLAAAKPAAPKASEINDRSIRPVLSEGDTGAAVVRLQVLLDRARFSPGQIDGRMGANTVRAAAAFRRERGFAEEAVVGAATWEALEAVESEPIVGDYTLTKADVSGPFYRIPHDMMEKSRLRALGYGSALERIAERFHSSPSLLQGMNPRASFRRAGETIEVPRVDREPLPPVAWVEVSDSDLSVSAWDEQGSLLARYPATLPTEHDPLCFGTWEVLWIRPNPRFHYDPALFWDANPAHTKATLAAGPNSPVGVVWIQLSVPSCGIHGTGDPSRIGKRESHGCIRLTNWDARELSLAVAKGTPVLILR